MKTYDADLLWTRLLETGLIEEIKFLCKKQNHSYGMILDFLTRDHNKLLDDLVVTRKGLSRVLKNNGIQFDLHKYNTSSNFWKLQYKANKAQIRKWAQQGQVKTVKIRKEHKSGWKNSKQTVDYYLQQGFSKEEAENGRNAFVKSNSPFCEEFYLSRGWSYKDAHEKLTNDRIEAALRSLKKQQKPKTELIIQRFLDEEQIIYSPQYSIRNDIGFDKRKKLVFDFYLPGQNKLIEINGTFWHADPRFFKPNDELQFPGGRKFLAREIWNRDKRKKECAIDQGYQVNTIWEKEINTFGKLKILEMING